MGREALSHWRKRCSKRVRVVAIAAVCGFARASISTGCRNATARSAPRRASCICRPTRRISELQGKDALTAYTFETGVAQHTFCKHCGMHAFYIPRSQPHKITVNARSLDGIDGPSLKPVRFFGGRNWEEAQAKRLAEEGQAPPRL